MRRDPLVEALSQNDPGLEAPAIDPVLLLSGLGSSLFKGLLRSAPRMARGSLQQVIGEQAPIRKAELLTPSEQSYQAFKDAWTRHGENYDFENVLKDKWGMLRNAGGN